MSAELDMMHAATPSDADALDTLMRALLPGGGKQLRLSMALAEVERLRRSDARLIEIVARLKPLAERVRDASAADAKSARPSAFAAACAAVTVGTLALFPAEAA